MRIRLTKLIIFFVCSFLLLNCFLLTGCQQAQQPSVTATPTPTIVTSSPTSTPSSTATATPTPIASGYIVLKESINKVQDSFGHARFYGELQNSGGKNVSFIQITITMKNANGVVIGTANSYLDGTVLSMTGTGSETNTCLKPGDFGAFEVTTSINYSDVSSYYSNIDWETYDTTNTSASLEIIGTINESADYLGRREYLGEIKNNSLKDSTFAEIYFISKDNTGKVIDISSSYVTGTDINANQTKSFNVSTSISSSEASSYYYKFDWSE